MVVTEVTGLLPKIQLICSQHRLSPHKHKYQHTHPDPHHCRMCQIRMITHHYCELTLYLWWYIILSSQCMVLP